MTENKQSWWPKDEESAKKLLAEADYWKRVVVAGIFSFIVCLIIITVPFALALITVTTRMVESKTIHPSLLLVTVLGCLAYSLLTTKIIMGESRGKDALIFQLMEGMARRPVHPESFEELEREFPGAVPKGTEEVS